MLIVSQKGKVMEDLKTEGTEQENIKDGEMVDSDVTSDSVDDVDTIENIQGMENMGPLGMALQNAEDNIDDSVQDVANTEDMEDTQVVDDETNDDVVKDDEEEFVGGGTDPMNDLTNWITDNNLNPDNVRKSFENYTRMAQEVSRERRDVEDRVQALESVLDELQPVIQLYETMQEYPEFGDYVYQYQPENGSARIGDDVTNQKVKELEDKIFQQEVNAGISNIRNSNPDFDFSDDELLEFMYENGITNPEIAFKAKYADDLTSTAAERAKKELEKSIKGGAGKRTVQASQPKPSKSKAPSVDDIASMDDESFVDTMNTLMGNSPA